MRARSLTLKTYPSLLIIGFGVIHTQAVEDGFRAVDRRYFVPQVRKDGESFASRARTRHPSSHSPPVLYTQNLQNMAHTDQPLREGNIHISAPHIYATVVEALELKPNSSQSFLNLGSGTGYLSSVVAEIVGHTCNSVAIELNEEAIQHCQDSIQRWHEHRMDTRRVADLQVIHGNALEIDATRGEALVGFDRIYIGASVDKRQLPSIANLLKPGGIFVGPGKLWRVESCACSLSFADDFCVFYHLVSVDDELVKILRIGNGSASPPPRPQLARSFRSYPRALSGDFSQQIISSVRFTPLLSSPAIPTVMPSKVWNPSAHHSYPESFRMSCKEILLCSRATSSQPPPATAQERVNVASRLPRALWMEILSYTHRDWFEPPHSDAEFLKLRLVEEQAAAQRARDALQEAEARLHMAERERDVYRLLAMRWQARLQSVTHGRSNGDADAEDNSLIGMDDIAEAASAVFVNEPMTLSLGGLRAMMRRFENDSDDGEDDEEEDAEAEESDSDHQNDMDHEIEVDEEASVMEEASEINESESMAVSPTSSSALVIRAQVRTVSITGDDL